MRRSVPFAVATALGFGSAANGMFMLISPANWHFAVPGVTITGPFNQHFVRDIGLIFMLVAIAMLTGFARPMARIPLWSAGALWLSAHALLHLCEVASGICGTGALARDFSAVTLSAMFAAALVLWAWFDARCGKPQLVSVEDAHAA